MLRRSTGKSVLTSGGQALANWGTQHECDGRNRRFARAVGHQGILVIVVVRWLDRIVGTSAKQLVCYAGCRMPQLSFVLFAKSLT